MIWTAPFDCVMFLKEMFGDSFLLYIKIKIKMALLALSIIIKATNDNNNKRSSSCRHWKLYNLVFPIQIWLPRNLDLNVGFQCIILYYILSRIISPLSINDSHLKNNFSFILQSGVMGFLSVWWCACLFYCKPGLNFLEINWI